LRNTSLLKIAIHFELNNDWIGGSYYIRNLVTAMCLLPDAEQPYIFLISENAESVRFIQETGYPKIGWITDSQYQAKSGALPFDILFPHPTPGEESRTISWVPDFQELHLDYFFSGQEIEQRRGHHRQRFQTAGLIVSSEDVKSDVEKFYPGECKRVEVVRFASFNQDINTDLYSVKERYGLIGPYVMCANQIWVHKNHITVIRAISILKNRGIRVSVVFTGNENDYRVPDYSAFLKRLVREWGIADQVKFLGFIPRSDQLCLMNGADYIVQPSLFEGWSTVIEDAKSMGKYVVASDLDVHKEQLSECMTFFYRHDPESLADAMQSLEVMETIPARKTDYEDARRGFAKDFMAAVAAFRPDMDPVDQSAMISDAELFEISRKNLDRMDQLGDPKKRPVTQTAQTEAASGDVDISKYVTISGNFKIALKEDNENFKILIIFSTTPVYLNRKYEKMMVKIIHSQESYQAELRSSSISPDILGPSNGDAPVDPGRVLRIALERQGDEEGLFGVTTALDKDIVEDINIVMKIGVEKMKSLYDVEAGNIPAFWRPIYDAPPEIRMDARGE